MINFITNWWKERRERKQYLQNLQHLSWELYETGWCKDMKPPSLPKPKSGEWELFPTDHQRSPNND